MRNENKKIKSGYTLSYTVNGKSKRINIKEKNFYTANEKALNVLKSEKTLQGKFNKDMNIKLYSNNNKDIYKLEWRKHPPLSGQGGYFTTFKHTLHKNKKLKDNISFRNTYAIPFIILLLGAFTTFLTVIESNNLENRFIWLLGTLMYSAIIPLVRSNFFERAKSSMDILWNNIILDSPIWLGSFLTMYSFIKGGIVTEKVNAIISVVFLLLVKLITSYGIEIEKKYNQKIDNLN
ncbi:amino acid transporter [Bacillus cereus]|uniref:amino acid transporter n=1 Tax=Bacillus cereus TaxID=1396 RepID=UPI003D65B192